MIAIITVFQKTLVPNNLYQTAFRAKSKEFNFERMSILSQVDNLLDLKSVE